MFGWVEFVTDCHTSSPSIVLVARRSKGALPGLLSGSLTRNNRSFCGSHRQTVIGDSFKPMQGTPFRGRPVRALAVILGMCWNAHRIPAKSSFDDSELQRSDGRILPVQPGVTRCRNSRTVFARSVPLRAAAAPGRETPEAILPTTGSTNPHQTPDEYQTILPHPRFDSSLPALSGAG